MVVFLKIKVIVIAIKSVMYKFGILNSTIVFTIKNALKQFGLYIIGKTQRQSLKIIIQAPGKKLYRSVVQKLPFYKAFKQYFGIYFITQRQPGKIGTIKFYAKVFCKQLLVFIIVEQIIMFSWKTFIPNQKQIQFSNFVDNISYEIPVLGIFFGCGPLVNEFYQLFQRNKKCKDPQLIDIILLSPNQLFTMPITITLFQVFKEKISMFKNQHQYLFKDKVATVLYLSLLKDINIKKLNGK